jgi:hypothetical protein
MLLLSSTFFQLPCRLSFSAWVTGPTTRRVPPQQLHKAQGIDALILITTGCAAACPRRRGAASHPRTLSFLMTFHPSAGSPCIRRQSPYGTGSPCEAKDGTQLYTMPGRADDAAECIREQWIVSLRCYTN